MSSHPTLHALVHRPSCCAQPSNRAMQCTLDVLNPNLFGYKRENVQFPKMNMVPLMNKPYVNGVTLRGQPYPTTKARPMHQRRTF